jgi:hypothetical protein
MMTKLERDIVELFKGGKSVDALHVFIGFSSGIDIEAVLRKALKAQDKKKGKA